MSSQSISDHSVVTRTRRSQASGRAACTVCHSRKVRCDAADVGIPCSNCRAASRDDCRIHRKRPRASKAAATARAQAQSQSQSIASPVPAPVTALDDLVAAASLCARPASDSVGLTGLDLDAEEDGEYLYKRHLVEFIDQPELTQRPIDNKARMMYIGTDVSNINFLIHQQLQAGSRASVSDNVVCHLPTNRLARRLTCHEPADRLPLDAFQLPPKAVVDQLLETYFRHINPGFPVVDERLFMQQYRARDSANPPSLLLLHAILVAGAHASGLYGRDQHKRHHAKATFFRRAKSLFDARSERNRDTIVQAALLLTWHSDGLEDVAANAWFWLGVAVRTATGLGMHRDADGSTLVSHNKRMWRRVWWLLFQCDVWISLQYGRPQSIRLDETNVQKLRASDFEDFEGDNARPEYLKQMVDLSIIISEALRAQLQATESEVRHLTLQKTDEKLASWFLKLPREFHEQTNSTQDVWSANLHLHYNTALIVLHRQPAVRPGESGESDAKHKDNSDICIAAATAIQNLFQRLYDVDGLKSLWTSSINCLFTALIQLSTEMRLSNPLLAISALRRYDSALVSLKRLAEYWPNSVSILHFFENSVRVNAAAAAATGRKQNEADHSRSLTEASTPSHQLSDAPCQSTTPSGGANAAPDSQAMPPINPLHDMWSGPFNESASGVATTSPAGTEEMLEAWRQWQSERWQAPEFSEEFLFTF